MVWWTQWLGQRQIQKVKITEYENISTECDYLWFVVQTHRDDMSQLKPILEDYSSWRLNSATIKQKQNVIISDIIFKYLNYLQQQLHSQEIQMIWTQLSKKDAYQDTDLCSKIWAWHIWVSWSYQSPWHRSSSAVVLLLLWWLILSVVVVVVVTHSSLHNNSCCCCVQDWVKLTVIINSICTNNNHFTP